MYVTPLKTNIDPEKNTGAARGKQSLRVPFSGSMFVFASVDRPVCSMGDSWDDSKSKEA